MRSIRKAGTCLLLTLLIASCASATAIDAGPASVEEEARRFMAGYAADLLSHDPEVIAARYSRRGTYVVFPGDWKLQPHDSIARMYREGWQGPESFEWQDLSYDVVGEDAVAVIGGFRFEAGENSGALGTYTAVLVREDGEFRIRLENESWDNLPPPECAAQTSPCDLPLDSAALDRYTGEYQVAGQEASARVYKEDGSLMVRSPGLPPMRLLYRGGHEFRLAEYPAVRLLFHGAGEHAETYILLRGLVLGTGERVAAPNGLDGRNFAVSQRALTDTILSLTHELTASWSRLDPDDYLDRFSHDLVFYVQGSRLSRDDFEAAIRQVMGAVRESTFEIMDPEVEVLGPNAAVVSFQWSEVTVDTDGSTADHAGAITLVYERRDGEWLVIRAHESLGPTP